MHTASSGKSETARSPYFAHTRHMAAYLNRAGAVVLFENDTTIRQIDLQGHHIQSVLYV